MNVENPITPTNSDGVLAIDNNSQEGTTVGDGTTDRVLVGFQKDGFGTGQDYGIKVSQDGYNVKTASDDQLVMSSAFNMFKIVQTGTVTIPEFSVQPDGSGVYVNSGSVTVDFDPAIIKPVVLAYTIQGANTSLTRSTTFSLTTYINESTVGTESWNLGIPDLQLDAADTVNVTSVTLLDPVTGFVAGNDLADSVELVDGVEATLQYGGDGEMWGLSPTAANINNSLVFGFGISLTGTPSGKVSNYLGANDNYGVVVPSAATVTGIQVNCKMLYDASSGVVTLTDGYTVTIYYQDPYPAVLSSLQFEGYYPVIADPSGVAAFEFLGYVKTYINADNGVLTFTAQAAYTDLGALGISEVTNGNYDIKYYILRETSE